MIIELTIAILFTSVHFKLVWYFIRRPASSSRPITVGSKLSKDVLYLIAEQDCMPPITAWEKWIKDLYTKAFAGIDGSKNYYYFAAAMLYRICYPQGFERGAKFQKPSSRLFEESAKDKQNLFADVEQQLGLKFRRIVEGKKVAIYIICRCLFAI